MLCYAMLCYATLCFAMLCYAMLSYANASHAMLMLCYATLCYAMLCYAILCWGTARRNLGSGGTARVWGLGEPPELDYGPGPVGCKLQPELGPVGCKLESPGQVLTPTTCYQVRC